MHVLHIINYNLYQHNILHGHTIVIDFHNLLRNLGPPERSLFILSLLLYHRLMPGRYQSCKSVAFFFHSSCFLLLQNLSCPQMKALHVKQTLLSFIILSLTVTEINLTDSRPCPMDAGYLFHLPEFIVIMFM